VLHEEEQVSDMSRKPAANTNDWLTKQQAAQTLNVAEKTIDRLAARGELQKTMRKRSGLPPLAVFHPGDVQRIAVERDKPIPPFPVDGGQDGHMSNGSNLPAVHHVSDVSHFAALIRALALGAPAAANGALYVPIEEAVRIVGLNEHHIRRRIADGTVRAARLKIDGRITTRVARADLEKI
jgi:hypothetical protein